MIIVWCSFGYLIIGFLVSLWVVYYGMVHDSDVDEVAIVVVGTTLIWPVVPFYWLVQWVAKKGLERKRR